MSLYGRTDSNENKAKAARGISPSAQAKQVIFVDNTEAALAENKKRGINAPGWWSYFTYTDGEGHTRHKAEHLVTIAGPDLNANETQADDAVAADQIVTITINTQPVDTTVADGAALQLLVAAVDSLAGDATPLHYQWQKKEGRRWINVGTDAATYDVAVASADDAGDYRVKITSDNGATEVISDTATVTVTA